MALPKVTAMTSACGCWSLTLLYALGTFLLGCSQEDHFLWCGQCHLLFFEYFACVAFEAVAFLVSLFLICHEVDRAPWFLLTDTQAQISALLLALIFLCLSFDVQMR